MRHMDEVLPLAFVKPLKADQPVITAAEEANLAKKQTLECEPKKTTRRRKTAE